MHLLLVEGDVSFGTRLQRALAEHGLTSEWVRTYSHALAVSQDLAGQTVPRFDCILLDLALPEGDGLQLLRRWRSCGLTLPVLALASQDGLASRLSALDTGADDYLVKTCVPIEIASRIHAVVRRSAGQSSQVWRIGDMHLDVGRREIRVNGRTSHLSPKEYRIVFELARMPDRVVSKQRLAQVVEPFSEEEDLRSVEWHVWKLRRKIGKQSIRTVRGVGYCMGVAELGTAPA
jgi:DNA-binding response OmpR family regulator